MDKSNYSQLELFSSSRKEEQKSGSENRIPHFLWRYEKTLLIIICFIVTSIISFSLGVEKGKRQASLNLNANLETASLQPTVTKQKTDAAIKVTLDGPKRTPNSSAAAKTDSIKKESPNLPMQAISPDVYTIQVASFKDKTRAEREAERFKKKGLQSIILSKGQYTILCIGRFPNKESARALLADLKKQKRYNDCYLRRL